MNTMFCSKCGTKIEEGVKFCASCGQSTSSGEQATVATSSTSDFKIAHLFKGRISRKHWILGLLVSFATVFVVSFLLAVFDSSVLFYPIYVIYIVFLFSLHIRRFHDLNHSGWDCIGLIIPLLNLILFLILALDPGEKEENKYGKPLPADAKLLDVLLGKTR